MKKVTKDICNCFDKIDQKGAPAAVKDEAEQCLISGMMASYADLVKAFKIDENDASAGEKIGQEIAMKLLKDCPSSVGIFMIIGSADDSGTEEEGGEEEIDEESGE
jgi:hypothetical protein